MIDITREPINFPPPTHQYCMVVNTNDDPQAGGLGQHRCQIQPASLAGVTNMQSLPWMKVISSVNSEVVSQKGTTKTTLHQLKVGDMCLAQEQPDGTWVCVGHPGTISDFASSSAGTTSSSNYSWLTHAAFGTTGKPPLKQTRYPTKPTYNNPQPPIFDNTQYKHVRDKAAQMLKNSQWPQNAQQLFNSAQNITQQINMNKITKLIQDADPQGGAEASKNLHAAQILDILRTYLNQIPSLAGVVPMAQQGQLKSLAGDIGSLFGIFQQMVAQATQMGAVMNQHNCTANTAGLPFTTQITLTANGQIISSNTIPSANVVITQANAVINVLANVVNPCSILAAVVQAAANAISNATSNTVTVRVI